MHKGRLAPKTNFIKFATQRSEAMGYSHEKRELFKCTYIDSVDLFGYAERIYVL